MFILYSPIITNYKFAQRALQSAHIHVVCPRTSHRIRKSSQEIEKTLSQGKREEHFRRATEEDPGQMQYMSCVQKETLQSYNTFN